MFLGARRFSGAEGLYAAVDAVESAFSTRKGVLSVVRQPQYAEYPSPLRMEFRGTGAICRDCGL
jgi:hypothetical protein